MRIKKIYFNRMYDQWRGEPLYIEDGLDDDKLYIRIMDVENYKRGAVNTITVDYKDLNGATYTILGECDYDKRLAIFDIPLSILSNNGVYEVGFSLSFNTKDKEGVMLKTAIQTFEIIDTIEADDEAIAQDPHYPILVDLINQLADYKVDTSIFPTREEMVNAIDESINLDKIIEQINDKGYITQTQLNNILKNYLTKFESSDFARRSDLNKFVTNIKFIQELDRYVLKSSMNNYVLKEEGKTLTTHDLTDELYEKLVNLDLGEDGVEIDLSEYQKKIDDILNTKDKTITGAINEIKNDIPTKTSQLQNDSGYLTEHQDLSDYAKKTELHSHENKDVLDNITTEKISSWDNKSEFDGDYDSLTNKPTIPTKVSELENDNLFVTEKFVDDKIIEASLGKEVDLSEYAKKTDIPYVPTKVSELENDKGYASEQFVDKNIPIEIENLSGTDNTKTMLDYLKEIVGFFISDTIILGNKIKYKHIIRGKINTNININEKEYSNISYISMINVDYNILTTFILADEGNLRIETPYTPILDDANMYIGLSISQIGEVHELIGSGSVSGGSSHEHDNKDILDTITQEMINTWNNKSDLTINDNINEVSKTQTYSNEMIESRLLETNTEITAVQDDLDSMDERVTYLETEQTKMGSFDGSYDSLTNKPVIPSKTSELTNDSGFTTKKYVDDKVAGVNASTITGLSTVATSGDYNDLTNKPTIPSEYTLPTASATQLGGVKIGAGLSINDGVLSANGGGTADSVDWSNVQNKPTIPSKVSQLTNDSGFITNVPSEYITETELEAKGYLTEHQDISGKVDKVDGKGLSTNDLTNTLKANYDTAYTHSQSTHAPSNAQKNSDITKAEIEAKLIGDISTHTHSQYLTEHQDLSNYALKTDLHEHDNKTILDNITQTTINMINNAIPYKGVVQASGNLNNCTATGFYKIQQGASNLPINEYSFLMVYNEAGQSTSIQVWFSATSDKQRIRRRANLTWGSWYTVYTENEPPTIPSEYITETELNDKGYATENFVTETVNNASMSGGYTHPETHPASMITGLSTVATSGSYNDLTNKPTIPSIEGLATETYVNNKVAGLVGSAPEALNTLNELATALGNDVNFATTVSNQIGSKVDKVEGKSLVLNTEIAKIHEHGNKDLLDTIEADNVHAHSNKSVIDTITSDMTTKWNKSIPFEDSYVDNCDNWLTNGYTKTSPDTANHPSVCTDGDRWGVLFYISENATNGTGTQMYFPIDGTYAGRIFTRKIVNRSAGAWNLVSTFNGSYNDLTDKPTIPSEYTLPTASADTLGGIKVGAGLSINDGVLSANGGGTADSVNWENVVGKPTFATVATSGDYNDLTNKPTIPTAYTHPDTHPASMITGLSTVATSGSYADLTNKPTIPTVTNDLTDTLKSNYDTAYTHSQSTHAPSNAQKNSDITKAEIEAKLTGNITTHTHSQYLTEHQSLTGYAKTADLSTVATSGSYNDLSDKPTIPTAYTHPTSHPASMITGLSTVATSGSYNDLSNKPTIPTIPSSLPANGGNADTVGGYTIWVGTQAQYNAISKKSSTTIYFIKEG